MITGFRARDFSRFVDIFMLIRRREFCAGRDYAAAGLSKCRVKPPTRAGPPGNDIRAPVIARHWQDDVVVEHDIPPALLDLRLLR